MMQLICFQLNTAQKVTSPSNGGYNFPIICHIINFITLFGFEFNDNAHFDTSFVKIAPNMKLHPIEGTYPGI